MDDVRRALTEIDFDGKLTSEVRYTVEELSDSTNINQTYDLIKKYTCCNLYWGLV